MIGEPTCWGEHHAWQLESTRRPVVIRRGLGSYALHHAVVRPGDVLRRLPVHCHGQLASLGGFLLDSLDRSLLILVGCPGSTLTVRTPLVGAEEDTPNSTSVLFSTMIPNHSLLIQILIFSISL